MRAWSSEARSRQSRALRIPAEQEISDEKSVEGLNTSLLPGDAAMAENEPTEVAESRAEPEAVEPRSAETNSFERLDELPSFSLEQTQGPAQREQPERSGGVHQDQGSREGAEESDRCLSQSFSPFDRRGDLESNAASGETLGSTDRAATPGITLSIETEVIEQGEEATT